MVPARVPFWKWSLALVIVWCCTASAVQACSIPVFRYALDHWRPDAYRLEVTADATRDPRLAALLRNLGDASTANVRLSQAPENARASRLLFPNDDTAVWAGTLDSNRYAQLLDSPARRTLVERLLSGDSGVWVLLDSGKADVDAAEVARLEKRLGFLQTVAALPTMDPLDPANRLGPGPELRVRFSTLRIDRRDANEEILRAMLLGASAVPTETEGPIVAVVFGRGRVLGAWSLQELTDERIDEACLFLLGACSCQAKNLNPGWDLLLAVDWEQALLAFANTNSVADVKPKASAPEIVRIESSAERVAPGIGTWFVGRGPLVFAGAGLLLGVSWWLARRRKQD